ncbi:MAG: hypothetical protein JXR82_07640 [Marinifilaceae bacterium]|nr:hypothetical protein [Marinifilaceae bacterium]
MSKLFKLSISILILFSCINSQGQIVKSDSINVIKTTKDFYDWYIYSTRNDKSIENRPDFIITANGIVCLDYSNYIANLKQYKFSDSLINIEILSYKNCDDNLKNISKTEWAHFDDIDDFEKIDCGFPNSYKWIGGQEMCDGIRINKVDFINEKTCVVTIEYYSINSDKYSYWGNNTRIKLIKDQNSWKIQDIDI